MNYINSICDGCGAALREEDDIVVCPECGTPQHRECYKKNNRCVNGHRHAEGFEWSALGAPQAPMPLPANKQEDTLPCPSCGHRNDKNAKVCENCSMKLIVFGMNLAETGDALAQEERSQDDGGITPEYKPPFVLGEGEGFDYADMPVALRQQPPAPPSSPVPPVYPTGRPPMQGIPPIQAPAKHYFLSRFIGPNSEKYIRAFEKLESGKSVTFNWAAFFLSPYWFFYRKLYKPGIIFLTVMTLISIVFSPIYLAYLTEFEVIAAMTDRNAAYEALMQLYDSFAPQLTLTFCVETAVKILAAIVAYPLYKKYTEKSLNSISHCPSPEISAAMTARKGGVSVFAVLIAWSALSFIEMIMSFIQNGGGIF